MLPKDETLKDRKYEIPASFWITWVTEEADVKKMEPEKKSDSEMEPEALNSHDNVRF